MRLVTARLAMVLAAGLALACIAAPASATDLRLLRQDDASAVFADLDTARTDGDGGRHGVVYAVRSEVLPQSQAQFSRFEDAVDCQARQIATQAITGYGRDFEMVQRLGSPSRWAAPDAGNQGEFDLFCAPDPRALGLRRLPTQDWKVAAAQLLTHLPTFRRESP